MVTVGSKKKKLVGKNVRISDKSHKLLAVYCKKNGFNLGAFCEMGALERMKKEVVDSVN